MVAGQLRMLSLAESSGFKSKILSGLPLGAPGSSQKWELLSFPTWWEVGNDSYLLSRSAQVRQSQTAGWAKTRNAGWGVRPGGKNMQISSEAWVLKFWIPCHITGSQCRKGLILVTFGMIKRRQTAVFSTVWMGCKELQKPRWEMIKAWTKSFAESLAVYSRIWLDWFCRLQTCGTKSRLLRGSCLTAVFSKSMIYSLVYSLIETTPIEV